MLPKIEWIERNRGGEDRAETNAKGGKKKKVQGKRTAEASLMKTGSREHRLSGHLDPPRPARALLSQRARGGKERRTPKYNWRKTRGSRLMNQREFKGRT